jgi:hypothetical protein
MRRKLVRGLAGAAALALALSCGGEKKQEPPAREVVEPLLQQEAKLLEAQGEQVNPSLGVESRWTIAKVEVRQQAGNDAQPWAGSIHFKITDRTRDGDGSVATTRREKTFEYVFDTAQNRWLIR